MTVRRRNFSAASNLHRAAAAPCAAQIDLARLTLGWPPGEVYLIGSICPVPFTTHNGRGRNTILVLLNIRELDLLFRSKKKSITHNSQLHRG